MDSTAGWPLSSAETLRLVVMLAAILLMLYIGNLYYRFIYGLS